MLSRGRLAPLIAAVAAMVLAVSACSRPATQESSAARGGSRAPADVLRVGLVALPIMPGNPFSSTGIPSVYTWAALFDSLTFTDTEGRVRPWLATAWRQVDARTWDFDLRRDVVFHNGVQFDAAAVVFAVEYLKSEPARRESVAREVQSLESAEALDAHTVRIRAREPSPLMPSLLAMMWIVEPGAWRRLGREGFSEQPVGTGPYRLVRWQRDGAVLEGFEQSWRRAKIPRLELRVIPDGIARVQAIQSGAIDIAVSIGPDDEPLLRAAGGRLDTAVTGGVLGLTFVMTRLPEGHPLRDARVRHALNYAVDRESYVRALLGGMTRAASQPAAHSVEGFDPSIEPYPYDPARARALLAEAGYPDGFSFMAEVAVGGGAADAAVYQTVAADLRRIGVDVDLQAIPLTQFVRNVQANTWRGVAFGMNYNAERSLDVFRFTRLHSCLSRRPWYCDQDVTAFAVEAQQAADPAARITRAQAVMRRYREEAPAIWLHEIVYAVGLAPGLQGFEQHQGYIPYERLSRTP